jgi:hypothetical protein
MLVMTASIRQIASTQLQIPELKESKIIMINQRNRQNDKDYIQTDHWSLSLYKLQNSRARHQ